MNSSTPHITPIEIALQERILTSEGQLAAVCERLGDTENALEKERLYREEIVAQRLEEERIAMESRLSAEIEARVRMELAEEYERLHRECSEEQERLQQDRAEMERGMATLAAGEAELEARRNRFDDEMRNREAELAENVRRQQETLAARVQEQWSRFEKTLQKTVNEQNAKFLDIQKQFFTAFIESMRLLPESTPSEKERIIRDYDTKADTMLSAASQALGSQIDKLGEKERAKLNRIGDMARNIFGRKSEKVIIPTKEWDSMQEDLLKRGLLSDADLIKYKEALAQHNRNKARLEALKNEKVDSGHGHNPIPDSIPVSNEIIIVPKVVQDNPGLYHKVDERITSTLHINVSYSQTKTVREVYALNDPASHPELPEIVCAEMPDEGQWKSTYGDDIRTDVLVNKYVNHMPLSRQEKESERKGFHINRSTMSDFIDEDVELYLRPLFPLLEKEVLNSPLIAADGVPMKVVDNEKKRTVSRYVTEIRSINTGAVIFKSYVNKDTDPKNKGKSGRSRPVMEEYFEKWIGYCIMCDAYPGYDFLKEKGKKVSRCLAHGRREFEKAGKENQALSMYPIMLIQMIYKTEEYISHALSVGEMGIDDVCRYRHTFAEPSWIMLKAWCVQTLLKVPDGSQMKKACNYLLRHYDEMTEYLDIPLMPLDNNATEREIRQLVMGRKNYLFSQSEESLQRDAIIYSFMATCRVNGKDPRRWLNDVKTRFESTPAEKLYTLLPQHWNDASKLVREAVAKN